MLSRSSAVPFAGMLGRRRRCPRRYCHDIGTGRFAQRGLDQSSREQALDYISTVVRQTLVPATVIVGEEFLVQAQQVQQCCMDIAQVMTLLNGAIADLVGRAKNAAGTSPATSKPQITFYLAYQRVALGSSTFIMCEVSVRVMDRWKALGAA